MRNNIAAPWAVALQFGARGHPFYDKHNTITKHRNSRDILEGESLPHGVLGVDGRHNDARERAVRWRRDEYSCLSGILLFL